VLSSKSGGLARADDVGRFGGAPLDFVRRRSIAGKHRLEKRHYLRYAFFMSPLFPNAERLSQFERDGVQVWSVTVP
jgi:hypothetical protein